MELQNIYLSILSTLLPDYLLHLFRMIGIMSSPIHANHYRYAPTQRTPPTSIKETDKARVLDSDSDKEGNTNVLLDTLQPQPLVAAMYSMLVADVVNNLQSALHQCTSQSTANAGMTGIQFDSTSEPSFCYFFIDMQPQSRDSFNYSDYAFDSNCKNVPDKQNMGDSNQSIMESTFSNLQRQRSISEGSDDSFICFEDDDGDAVDSAFGGHIDYDSSISIANCKPDDQDQDPIKRVRFNLKPKVHVMHTWDFAYRAARKGEWQEIARDRDRFQQRIRRVATILNGVLSSNHREKIFKDRFLDVN
ncbi:hypothetical protein KR222_004101 [Zaprionus bogoriensis]|nr:hypothetical protein KR222_004101 [Zaprionus bogoriensis]